MRAAGMAMIAFNRFCRMISRSNYRPLSGVSLKIGRENFSLAPSSILSHTTGNTPYFINNYIYFFFVFFCCFVLFCFFANCNNRSAQFGSWG